MHLYENLLNGCEMVESQYVYPLNLISDFMPWDFVNFSEKLKVSNQVAFIIFLLDCFHV